MRMMSRLRALVIVAAVVVGTAVPAAAQTPPSTPDSTPESTPDSTPTTPPDSTIPEDTTPDSTVPPDTTTPTTLPAVDDPGINGDAPPESVPQNDVVIPDATIPAGAADSTPVPPRADVVQIDVLTARASALLRQAAYSVASAQREELEIAVGQLQIRSQPSRQPESSTRFAT